MVNKLKERLRQNRGALIVESAFVYPIMFFVIFFLIFMGNMFYLRARIESMVTREAIRSAAEYADPNLSHFAEGIPVTNKDERVTHNLYRYIDVLDLQGTQEEEDTGSFAEKLGAETGFFKDMEAANIVITEHQVHNYVFYQTYAVEASYELRVPIKHLFRDDYLILDMTAREEVPVTDTSEFIRNVDMAVDLTERTKAGEDCFSKLEDLYNKVDEIVNGEDSGGSSEAVAGGASGTTQELVKLSTCSSDELYRYLLKNVGKDAAEEFLVSGKWPDGIQIPKNSSVLTSDGSIDWTKAPNGGYTLDADGNAIREAFIPQVGEIIDRYGAPNGRYTSPIVNDKSYEYTKRSLPYVEDTSNYHQYEVVGDFTKIKEYVDNCTDAKLKAQIEETVARYYEGDYGKLISYKGDAAAVDGWGEGGAVQYEFSLTVEQLEGLGLLKEIKNK